MEINTSIIATATKILNMISKILCLACIVYAIVIYYEAAIVFSLVSLLTFWIFFCDIADEEDDDEDDEDDDLGINAKINLEINL